MESAAMAMTDGKAMGAQAKGPDAVCLQVPLSFLKSGEEARIVRVRGKEELLRYLETLGFVPGARVKAVSQTAGNVIVEIKGAQIALDRRVAMKVATSAFA